ncbi:MAG: phosphoribosylglycinamide formyltransferase [Pirellulales bacterium]|jgi:phosphoribosylglycinamide formyltransferase-1
MPDGNKIAVLISGSGTTLKNLIHWRTEQKLSADIELVISNNVAAGGLVFASEANIPHLVVSHKDFKDVAEFSDAIFSAIQAANIDLVVMGGFLRRLTIPPAYENRVINIHPSLIPAFCGQGFYGQKVHQAVIDYGCKISGCSVHYVDDQYDHGPIIAQETVPVEIADTAKTLAKRIFAKECQLYPDVINKIIEGDVMIKDRCVEISQR